MSLNVTWTQFQGGPEGAGYIAVRTAPAVQPTGIVGVGDPGGSSPIVDPLDGTIYVASTNGVLHIVNPDLTVRSRAHGVRTATGCSTPAQDAAGRIYVIFESAEGPPTKNVLVCFSRTGNVLWKYDPPPQKYPGTSAPEYPAFLFGTPKVWSRGDRTLVFVIFSFFNDVEIPHCGKQKNRTNYLLALDEKGIPQGLILFHETPFFCLHGGGGARFAPPDQGQPPVYEPPPAPREQAVGFGVKLTYAGSKLENTRSSPVPLLKGIRVPEPAPCIFQDSLGVDRPVVVVCDGHTWLGAFRWQDSGPKISDPGFSEIWGHFLIDPLLLVPPAFFPSFLDQFSSPALFLNGLLSIGTDIKRVALIDPASGDFGPPPPPALAGAVDATPASFLRQVYTVDRPGHVSLIDSNGHLVKTVALGGESAASPLVTGSFVYVAAADGVYTFDFLLQENVAKFSIDPIQGMGVSSFAVGPDGTVYACSAGQLFAFPPP